MENFRKQIKRRLTTNVVLAIFLVALFAALLIMDATNAWRTLLPIEVNEDGAFMAGFRSGFCTSLLGFVVMKIVIYSKALKDEKKLKSMYINETDERSLMIAQKTSSASFAVTIMGLAIACVIMSFISRAILYTLVCIIFFIVIVQFGFKIYFNKKY